MTAHAAMPTRHALTHTAHGVRVSHQSVAIAGAALAVALLLGGCDSAKATGVEPKASPTTMVAATEDTPTHLAPQSNDEAGVAAVVAAWDAAWNAGDANGIAATFTDDGEFINGRGQIASGAATIRANHAASLAGVFRGSHTVGRIRRITFLTGTTAVIDSDGNLTGFSALPAGTVPTSPGLLISRQKRVVVKRGGTWRVVLMQLTSVAPPQ